MLYLYHYSYYNINNCNIILMTSESPINRNYLFINFLFVQHYDQEYW
jgi:hypothetical protein